MKKRIIYTTLILLVVVVSWKIYEAGGVNELVVSTLCKNSCEYKGEESTKLVSETVTQPNAQEGDFTHCPFSQVLVSVNKNTARFEYKGEIFYTCCNTCLGFLEKEPDKYLEHLIVAKNEGE